MIDKKLEEILQELITSSVSVSETDRQKALKENEEAYLDINAHFKPGTFGAHEALDRTIIVQSNLESFVLNHPTVTMDQTTYQLTHLAMTLLLEVYQRLSHDGEEVADENES